MKNKDLINMRPQDIPYNEEDSQTFWDWLCLQAGKPIVASEDDTKESLQNNPSKREGD